MVCDPLDPLTLLSGDAQVFVEKSWASRVHVHHTDPAALVGLLSLDDVDQLVTSTAIRTPVVRMAKDGSVLPESGYTRQATVAGQPLTGLVDSRKLLDLFSDGATIVLQGLHRYWQPLGDLVAELELVLGHPCQANAYLTPRGSQGFALHSDSHDVFVFQTHGSKQWEVHEDDIRHDVRLEPGVSMYLPTGTPHAARAEDEVSLHVTLGINQLTWRSVLEPAVRRAMAVVADEHLPAGYLANPARLRDGLATQLSALVRELGETDTSTLATAQMEAFLTGRNTRVRGGLADRVAVVEDQTTVRRRAGHPCVLVPNGDRLRVLLGDRELDVPGRLEPALARIRSRGTLRPADLADLLDESGRLVLCRRLVREGLLEALP